MVRFCPKCGTPVGDDDSFCPKCGFPVSALESDTTENKRTLNKTEEFVEKRKQARTSVNRNTDVSKRNSENNSRENPKKVFVDSNIKATKKRSYKGVIAIILIIAILFTGFKWPGFFVDKNDDISHYWGLTQSEMDEMIHSDNSENNNTDNSENNNTDDYEIITGSALENTDWENIDYTELANKKDNIDFDPAKLDIRYTSEEISAVTPDKASISWANPVGKTSDVKVDFKAWNLENENDELQVRKLGEKTDTSNTWSIVAYDLSLASGQEEFDTDVEITIPKTAKDGEVGTCVTFNEETQEWEELLSEVSEDGKNYIIKTNHFSVKGERKVKYHFINGSVISSEKEDIVNLDNGIFHERYDPENGTRMQSYVFADRQLLWDMYLLKTDEDVKLLYETMQDMSVDPSVIQDKPVSDRNAASFVIGTAGGLDNVNSFLKNVGYNSPFVGKFLTYTDLILTLLAVKVETIEDPDNWKLLKKSIENNAGSITLSIASSALSYGASAIFGNVIGAAVGLCIWGTCTAIDMASQEESWDVKDDPDWGDLHKTFYLLSGAKVDCGSKAAKAAKKNNKYTYAIMKQPKSMSDKNWKALSKVINKNPISVVEVEDEETGEASYRFVNIAKAFAKIIELYYNEPYTMEKVIDEFYGSYAMAFWNLSDKALYNFALFECELGEGEDYFKEYYTTSDGTLIKPTKEEKKEYKKEFVASMKAWTAEELEAAADMAVNKTFSILNKNIYRFEKLMNTRLVFHVKDKSLLGGETFADSAYCIDWYSIPENKEYLPSSKYDASSGGYDDEQLIVPMRFVCNDPLFKPLEGVKQSDGSISTVEIPYTEYYPYTPDFIPRVKNNQNSDIVYMCTLYHYMMMGAPKQMLFKDCSNPSSYVDQQGVLVDIKFPEITEESSTVDVYIEVEGQNAINKLDGMWVPPTKGSKYDNNTSSQIVLTVNEKDKYSSFYSNMEGVPSFSDNCGDDDSKIVYREGGKNDKGNLTGTLILEKKNEDKRISYTIEEINDKLIYIKELDYYLEKYSAAKGKYSLTNEEGTYGMFVISEPATLTLKEDGTMTLVVPRIKDAACPTDSHSTISNSKLVIKGKQITDSNVPYDDNIYGKYYAITEITDHFTGKTVNASIDYRYVRKYYDFILPKEDDLISTKSNVLIGFDSANKNKVLFAHITLMGKCDVTTWGQTNTSDEATLYLNLNVTK